MSGPLEVVGSVVLPGLAVLTLLLVPFIDRGRMIKVAQRTVAMAFVALAVIGWGGLTALAVATKPAEAPSAEIDYSGPTDWIALSPEELAGIAYFRQENCVSCHAIGEGGSQVGPDLTRTSIHRDAAWMLQHFKQPGAVRPGTSMPAVRLTDAQLNSLTAFLLKLNPKNATALQNAPEFAVQGAVVYQNNDCGSCHQANGVGTNFGPTLNGLSKRRSRSWVEQHFADPTKLSPGSMMPPYKLSAKDMDRLTTYLFSLPE